VTENGSCGGGVWIRTTPDTFGTYRCVVELDDDTSHPITRDTAPAYARAILQAVSAAEYDAAVIRQMTQGSGLGRESAVCLVRALRGERPPIAWPSPLRLEPGVSAAAGEPFLAVWIHGVAVGQWTVGQAREHAAGVMEAVEVADLDGGYLRALRAVDVDMANARAVVGDLGNHRP
jgi:hypothetical protein